LPCQLKSNLSPIKIKKIMEVGFTNSDIYLNAKERATQFLSL
jgi:hypothetical protein